MKQIPDHWLRYVRVVGTLTLVPFLLAVAPLVGFGIGCLLERWLGTGEFLRYILLAIGFAAGVREVVRLLQRVAREIDRL